MPPQAPTTQRCTADHSSRPRSQAPLHHMPVPGVLLEQTHSALTGRSKHTSPTCTTCACPVRSTKMGRHCSCGFSFVYLHGASGVVAPRLTCATDLAHQHAAALQRTGDVAVRGIARGQHALQLHLHRTCTCDTLPMKHSRVVCTALVIVAQPLFDVGQAERAAGRLEDGQAGWHESHARGIVHAGVQLQCSTTLEARHWLQHA